MDEQCPEDLSFCSRASPVNRILRLRIDRTIRVFLSFAFAGALTAPSISSAQPSVIVTGLFKASLENLRIQQPGPGRAGRNTSEVRLPDDSSRIVFIVAENLGGGLSAIGQADLRVPTSSGNYIGMQGNTFVGVRSNSMGRIVVGRHDVHYYNNESYMTILAGDLRSDAISVISFMRDGSTAIAGGTRTPNLIHYISPNWGGLTVVAGYSTGPANSNGGASGQPNVSDVGAAVNPAAVSAPQQGDLQSSIRKGYAFVLNPTFAGLNFRVGWSYWNSKPDTVIGASQPGNTLGSGDQLSNKLYASYSISDFRIGLAWDKSQIKSSTAGAGLAGVAGTSGAIGSAFAAGTVLGNRTAWSVPASYIAGKNQFHFHYTKARDDRATPNVQDGAKMVAFSYQYAFSKRTSVGLTYAKITNDAGAAYNFFTSASLGNSLGSAVAAGEDPRIYASTIRVAF